jgi:hypothetical protein
MSRANHHEVASEAAGRDLEAVEVTKGETSLAAVLATLVALLSRLAAVLDRPAKPTAERLALRIDELADALGVSRRAIERERAAGRFPKPDAIVGKMPLWRPETVRSFLERGGRP